VAQKFAAQLERLLGTAAQDNYTLLHQRIEAAASYFANIIDALIDLIQQHASVWQELSRTKKYIKDLSVLQQVLKRKKLQMQHASHITAGLAKGLDAVALLQIVEEQRKTGTAVPAESKKESSKLPKGQTRLLTLELYRQGKRVDEIAVERNLSPITIESHLAACVETGEIEIQELVPESKIATILKAIEETESAALNPIKEKLGSNYSYAEIKAVIGYHRLCLQEKAATENSLS
ncbi:MAG: helix-turn-helix domain-containing protein, partial [Flavisolibacter sp.]|nr:helix-turn-helix domain-containing protein [Flavisolibacter sp.]